jgi:hypothetical protein
MIGRNFPLFSVWRSSALFRIAAALAFVTQVGVLAADVAEGSHGVGSAAHVERSGTARHYAHDDATCAACAVRSLHASAPSNPSRAPEGTRESRASDARVVRPAVLDQHSPRLSRAPPSMI